MTQVRRLCDVCGKPDSREVMFFTGREMDAAGSMDSTYDSIDLCAEHAVGALCDAWKNTPVETVKAYVSTYRAIGSKSKRNGGGAA